MIARFRRWIGGPCPNPRDPVGRAVFIDGKPYVLTLMEWNLNQPTEYELEALGYFLARHYAVRGPDGEEMHLVEDALVMAGWTPPGGTEDSDVLALEQTP